MAKILIDNITFEPGKEAFERLHGKSNYLGSSEIAVVAGLNRFQTPLQLWMKKTGRDTSTVDNWAVYVGNLLEPVVGQMFEKKHPEYSLLKNYTVYSHDTIEWATCTQDYNLSYPTSSSVESILEIKTSGIWAKQEWDNGEVPDFALCQLQWQLGILGHPYGYLAALIGGKEYFDKEVKFSPDAFSQLVELGEKFLSLVKSDTPPDANFADDLSFIRPTVKSVELNCRDLLDEYQILTDEIKRQEDITKLKQQARDTIKNKIIQLMGDAGEGKCGDYLVTRKVVPIKESLRKAYEQIRFSIKTLKEK
jgi:putative phage-type endonuclease